MGAVRLDVARDKIDFLSSGSQKWLLGLQGMAFIYVSEELQENMVPGNVGWLSVEDAWNILHYDLTLKRTAERFQGGTLNTIGIYALNASLKMFKEFGYDVIENKVIENSSYLINKLEEINIKPVLSNCDKKNIAGIVSFKHNESKKIFEELVKKDIQCAVREGLIRMSPHFYNTKEEADKIVDELKQFVQ